MPTDVIMPQMGESIFEGTITRWLKKPGDPVEKDEPLLEISTDKVDAEIPSPAAGILSEIKVPEGATVQVDTVLGVIADSAAEIPARNAVFQLQKPSGAPEPAKTEKAQHVEGGVEVVMPQMGESVFEGTITKWLKKPGDPVEKDEPLLEISTDKVDAEIPSPAAGVLTEIKVPEGVTVQVNTVLAVIGGAASPAAVAQEPVPAAVAVPAPSAVLHLSSATAAAQQVSHVRSSPLVRRIARENNLDLSRMVGTGSAGRVTKQDVLAYLAQRGPGSAQPSSKTPATPQVADEIVLMSKMRAIIAQRMVESVQTSPHAHTVYKVDMTRVARARARSRDAFEKRHGVKLTYMPFIATAAIEALGSFPILNASLEGSNIRYHRNVHLGIAVALEWGLIVPVIRQAEQRSFVELARMIADLAQRARTKKLLPEEAGGSTFTLTNSGAFGGEFGTPILNQPESAILAIGGLHKEPAVLTDAEGNDTIAIRSVQYYCLGFDHRLIDGADSGKFMLKFQQILESWNRPIV